MTKEEMLAFGVDPERVKEFSRRYHEDLRKQIVKLSEVVAEDKVAATLRSGILGLLPTVRKPKCLLQILLAVCNCYFAEVLEQGEAEAKKNPVPLATEPQEEPDAPL